MSFTSLRGAVLAIALLLGSVVSAHDNNSQDQKDQERKELIKKVAIIVGVASGFVAAIYLEAKYDFFSSRWNGMIDWFSNKEVALATKKSMIKADREAFIAACGADWLNTQRDTLLKKLNDCDCDCVLAKEMQKKLQKITSELFEIYGCSPDSEEFIQHLRDGAAKISNIYESSILDGFLSMFFSFKNKIK